MSKELVISAASHERRVAILEEGQLVEIYIEREKEFALVGSIYKGRVTRVLPGMQSAFVDIGLDGDAFLYVSDVFENLEDYDHGHGHAEPHAAPPPISVSVRTEALPGETLGHASEPVAEHDPEHIHHEHGHHDLAEAEALHESHQHNEHHEHDPHEHHVDEHDHEHDTPLPIEELEAHAGIEEHHDADASTHSGVHAEPEERQPESNASAPQNFGHQYNPTQKYPPRNDRGGPPRNDRGGHNFGRGDQGGDRGGQGGDRGRGGRWGRRGGRRRGGRPSGPGGPTGGRNLPPSKYASPQSGDQQRSGESRGGYDQRGQQPRGQQPRGFDNRRPETGSRPVGPAESNTEDEIILPGESLAKYRNKPVASAAPVAPVAEPEAHEPQPDLEEPLPRSATIQPTGLPSGPNAPRRSSGGLPRWLLAETGTEAEPAPDSAEAASPAAELSASPIEEAAAAREAEGVRVENSLSEEDVDALSLSLVEAKQEETQAKIAADAIVGGAVFEDEEEEADEAENEEEATEESREELSEETEEIEEVAPSESVAEETSDEALRMTPQERADAEADAAHDDAVHDASQGEHLEVEAHEHEHGHAPEHGDVHDRENELIEASSGAQSLPSAPVEDDVILLPGETRSPRSASAPREDFAPRDSARIGSGNPRSRFQRPFRSGGRDRGRDNRGGDRGPRSGSPSRGGRPGGRFERRPSGPSGPRHDRGYQGGRSGPPRRPQLISEMLKAGQDVVIQIAKEPLGKKGARITSHVALPGRFLVYMPTVHHTGVSRKIISAENRSRLRRLVSEAGNAYPGGFIVRTAAGEATDDEIRADIDFLGKTWNEIKERSEQRKAPALLHRDLDLVERMLRDYVSDDFSAIWIDNEEEYGKVVEFVSRFQPKLVNRVKLYTKETPIFEEFGIQHELDKALRAKVWLKSGGYIVINHTEALVAIDVNTGKFVGKGSTRLEDTIVKTNIEAVKEIVRQIRLRDLGGIIVVDFIDMEERRNREKVLSALQQALEQDKAPSKALSFNEFGLVCITRKRTKQALERVLCQPCPYCTGSGMVKSSPTLCYEIQAEARKMAAADHESPNLTLRVHPEIAKALKTRESMLIDELEQTTHKHVIIQSDATLHWEQYDIY
jgi:Rne/Rng family ribonuclease